MKNIRSQFFLVTAVGLLFALTPLLSYGQISPVRLKVNKVTKKERVERESGDKPLIQQVLYEVELSNASTAASDDLTIKWAILYKPYPYNNDLKILEGDRTCSLGIGQRYKFETDSLEVPMKKRAYYNSRGIRSSSGDGLEILGYLVEVYSGKKILASDIQPSDIKTRIQKVRDAEEKKHGAVANPKPDPKPAAAKKN